MWLGIFPVVLPGKLDWTLEECMELLEDSSSKPSVKKTKKVQATTAKVSRAKKIRD